MEGDRVRGVICGVGTTKLGKLNRPLSDLVREGVHRALEDAGLPIEAVKGLVSMPSVADLGGLSLMPAHQMAMELGMLTRPGGQEMICKTIDCGGASPVVALREACQLLTEENLGCVAVIGADAVGSMPTKEFLRRVGGSNDRKGAVIPEKYDDFAAWHMRTFGTTREHLASVSEFMSLQAAKHPASSGRALCVKDVLKSPRVAGRTNLYECAKRADGAAVAIVCSVDFARERDMVARGVPILGIGEASGALMPEAAYIGAHSIPIHAAASRALKESGLSSVENIDWFGLYDCFPVAFLSSLEQVGLCGYGKGGEWVTRACQRLREGKKVNVNTHGGLLGAGAPWEAPAMFTIVEAVDQILGRCPPDRQIDGVRRALVQANGGTFSHEAVAILGPPTILMHASRAQPSATEDSANFKTQLTSMLGIKYPVMCAGMGGVARARLVAEVSEAGGMGCLGAASMAPQDIEREIREIKRMTTKPFAVNILALDKDIGGKAEVVAASGARAFITGLGVARSVVDYMHKHNVLVGVVCGQVKHAVDAVRAGCDFVIAQGTEAGGHTGEVALFALLPQIRSAVPSSVPVVAAGGIHNGRTLVSAMTLGASGAWIGTRFLSTYEANTVKGYKERLLSASSAQDTTITRYYTGKPCRVLKNKQTADFAASGKAPAQFPEQFMRSRAEGKNHLLDGTPATVGVDVDGEFMPAGQVVGSIGHLLPTRRVMESIMDEARLVIREIARPRL